MDKKNLLEIAKEGAKKTGYLLLKEANCRVESEEGKDIKLSSDIRAHEFLCDFLSSRTSLEVLSEEGEKKESVGGLHWLVDPLDGSLNFYRDIPISAISIALMDEDNPIAGIVYDFNREELFFGMEGFGSQLNDIHVEVSKIVEVEGAVLGTGFPSKMDYSSENIGFIVDSVKRFKKVRLLGSSATSMAYVASGRMDVYFEREINLWDVAAGAAIIRAAGGKVTLKRLESGRYTVLASNASISGIESFLS